MRDTKRHQQLLDDIAECRRVVASLNRFTDDLYTGNMLKRAVFDLNSAEHYIGSANRCASADMEELWLGIAEWDVRSARRHLDIIPANTSVAVPPSAGAGGI
jgi:hypothetical protein